MNQNYIVSTIAAALLCAPLAACKTQNATGDEMESERMSPKAEAEVIADAKDAFEVLDRPDDAYDGVAAMSPVYFGFDSAELTDADRVVLDVTAAELREAPEMTITLAGHADEVGPDEPNRELGMKRAEAVKDYLVSVGIEDTRLNTISYGETKPAVDTAENVRHWRNRRVEFEK